METAAFWGRRCDALLMCRIACLAFNAVLLHFDDPANEIADRWTAESASATDVEGLTPKEIALGDRIAELAERRGQLRPA